MKRPRLVDVAARAGVSRTTASAALGNYGRIGEPTRKHVQAVAADMGYEVNRLAQNLRIQRAGAIAVYLPPDATGYEYYLDFTFGVVDQAMSQETPVVLIPNGTSEASLARDHVDGYIVIDAIDGDPQLQRILASGKPVVAAEPLPPGAGEPAGIVSADHGKMMTALLNHLAANGARRPAMITPPLDTAWARQIDAAYNAWCAAARRKRRVATAPLFADASSIAGPVEQLFDAGDVPDAVIVVQDGIVAAVAASITSRGHVLGSEVLLAAYVDGLGARSANPPVTAVDLLPRQHGKLCAEVLLSILSGDPQPRSVALTPVLRIRASTLRN